MSRQLIHESLEDRRLLAALTVNSLDDRTPEGETVAVAPAPLAAGPTTLNALPTANDQVFIVGTDRSTPSGFSHSGFRFDRDGTFNDKFAFDSGVVATIATNGTDVFTGNFGSNVISRYSPDGALLGVFADTSALDGNLSNLEFDSAGNLYASHAGSVSQPRTSVRFDRAGSLTETFSDPRLVFPQGIDADASGNVWIANAAGVGVGVELFKFSSSGSLLGQFDLNDIVGSPSDIAIDEAGNRLFIADEFGSDLGVSAFNIESGSPVLIGSIATPGLTGALGLSYDSASGNLFVADDSGSLEIATSGDVVNTYATTELEGPWDIVALRTEIPDTDVTLSNGILTITDSNGGDSNDDLTIRYADGIYTITDNGGLTIDASSIPGATGSGTSTVTISDASVASLIVNTLGGDDSLTIDRSGDDWTVPIAFNGGDNNDEISLLGGTATTLSFHYATENDGDIDIDGATIQYTGLEPITSTITAVDIVLNFGATDETITVTAVGAGLTNVDSDTGGETTTFANPTGSLTINTEAGGGGGADTILLRGLGSGFDANLSVSAGTDDSITLQTSLTNVGSGNVELSAGSVLFDDANLLTTGAISLAATAGSITTNNINAIDLQAASATLTASDGVGTSAAGGWLDTRVDLLEGSSGAGGFFVRNSASFAIGGVGPLEGVSTTSGDIELQSSLGMITVGEDVVSASGSISLTATDSAGFGNDLTVQPSVMVQASTGSVTLRAGDDLMLSDGSTVSGNVVSLQSDFGDADVGVGTTVSILGTITSTVGPAMADAVGNDDDLIILNPGAGQSSDAITLNGRAGNDRYNISFGRLAGDVNIADTVSGNDQANLFGTTADETFNIDGQNGGTIENVTVGETVVYASTLESLTLIAGDGNDTFTGSAGADSGVEPSFSTLITLDGGNPVGTPPDDLMILDPLGNAFLPTVDTIQVDGDSNGSVGEATDFRILTFLSLEQAVDLNSANVSIVGTADDDILTVNATSSDSGTVQLTSGGVAGPIFSFSGANSLSFSGLDGDDVLRINNPVAGLFDPADGISFFGGAQVNGDSLEVLGGAASIVEHVFLNDHDGSIFYDGEVTPTISYTGLEPVIDTITATTRVFTFTCGAETITLGDGAAANDNLNQIDSTLGESVLFTSPSSALTVNAGSGVDVVNVTMLDTLYAASLIVDGGATDTDTLTMTNVDLINTPGRGLAVSEFETVTITAGTISGNTAVLGGGIRINDSTTATTTATLDNVTISDNRATESGGGIWSDAFSLTIQGGSIADNAASGNAIGQGGGGVFNLAGTLDIDNAAIQRNHADGALGNGGGVMTVGGTVTIDNTTIASNEAARAGGGVENNGGNVTLTNVTAGGPAVADGNTAGVNGGGLHASGAASVTLVDGGSFQNNVAAQEGGGLWNGDGQMTIRNNTTIVNNTANSGANAANDQGGGGVFNIGGTLDIDDATITSNLATANNGNGGGVMTVGGTVTIDNTTIASNAAARAGGGVENNGGNVSLTNVTVGGPAAADGNTADVNGGGLHASGAASVTLVDGGSFQNNVAAEGGGLWNGDGIMLVTGTQIDSNMAFGALSDQAGGGAFNSTGTLTLDGVALTNNLANSGDAAGGGAFNDQGTMNVLNSTIHGNDLCALTYLRPSGSIVNNTFGVNVGGNLCPLLGTDNDDIILVTDDTITINADSLFYDDDTLGPITIESALGNDRFDIRSTDADNPIIADAGDGDDVIHISSDAPTDAGTLNGILGDVTVIGGPHSSTAEATETVTARRAPATSVSVSAETPVGDILIVSDDSSPMDNSYTLSDSAFQRTAAGATGVISYQTVETLDIETGNGNDTVEVSTTVANNQVTLSTSGGDDQVTIVSTGADSIFRLNTEGGADTVEVQTSGDQSVLQIDTADQADTVTILNRGSTSGIDVTTGQEADTITLGDPVASASAVQTNSRAVIHVQSDAGEDTFDINEVFYETIVELLGGDDNDTFNLNASGADAAGFLGRINDDPIGAGGQDAQARTRELLIDGGDNGGAIRTFVEGITVDASNQFSETNVPNQDVGDTINVNAQDADVPLDLRYVITANAQGVLATTTPRATQAERDTTGNEVVDSLAVENFNINTGLADEILTITSEIPFGIEQSDQAIRWDGGGGANDRLEVLGTDQADRITIGRITGDPTIEPIEIDNVEYARVDGNEGDDQIANDSTAISVLNGGLGADTMLGGVAQDVLTGGDGVDFIGGRGGNDILLSDQDFGSDTLIPVDGDFIDGGDQDNLTPGDTCIQIGLDKVVNCEVLGDGGAEKDVLTWLRAVIVPIDSLQFETDPPDPRLAPFDPVAASPVPLVGTTEISSLFPAGSVPAPGGVPEGENVFDVNVDGAVTALDALIVINEMAANSDASVAPPEAEQVIGTVATTRRTDVNRDGQLSALDALLVINELSRAADFASIAGEQLPVVPQSSLIEIDPSTEETVVESAVGLPEELVTSAKPSASTTWADLVDQAFDANLEEREQDTGDNSLADLLTDPLGPDGI
ncbi:dockerin type I domain-containing protein [Novipirellula artificiosorum]|nr:dockerin type I domain-containing protein [Novipirellula artificiosorum]